MKNNWYVLTGGPSSGKTTLIREFEKKGYLVVPEMATEYIKGELAKGITIEEMLRDVATFQKNILLKQLAVEKELSPSDTIVFDRGMHDHYGYLDVHGVSRSVLSDLESELAKGYYKKVFITELLDFKPDPARMESGKEAKIMAKKIESAIIHSYTERGLEIMSVPVLPVQERTDFILANMINE